MSTSSHASHSGSYELVDNVDYGNHQQVLTWLGERFAGPLNVATGYISLEGLDALAKIATEREQPTRLLIGVAPETLAGQSEETVADHFEQSVSALRRQRDFSAFPAARRAVLERVTLFFESDSVAVRLLRAPLPARQSLRHRPTGRRRISDRARGGSDILSQPDAWRACRQPRAGHGAVSAQRRWHGVKLAPALLGRCPGLS